jgi:hypothetical protein
MNQPDKDNQEINDGQDETNAQKSDVNDSAMPADDGFKTGNKTHGLTWEAPMDEQGFDTERMDETNSDEEGD